MQVISNQLNWTNCFHGSQPPFTIHLGSLCARLKFGFLLLLSLPSSIPSVSLNPATTQTLPDTFAGTMNDERLNAALAAAAGGRLKGPGSFAVPFIYRAFFLCVEPLSVLAGAYLAHARQADYLRLSHAASAPSPVPMGTSIVLSQLANMYLFFALVEALVLRATSDIRVWKTLLFCLLIGDFGHLYSVHQLGLPIYWSAFDWNAIDWGNIPFVYLGATLRVAFLANVGLGAPKHGAKTRTA